MQLIKKFGLLFTLSLFTGSFCYAQAQDNCGSENVVIKSKRDPIDFIHNYLLKPSAQTSTSTITTIISKDKKSVSSIAVKPTAKVVEAPKVTEKKTPVVVAIESKKAIQAIKASDKKTITVITTQTGIQKNDNTARVNDKKAVTDYVKNDFLKSLPVTSISNDKKVVTTNDLIASRMVSKPVMAVKKTVESSFGSSMMEWVKDKYSAMIDVLPNQISNVMLYRFIDDWYGVKYRMGGTSKNGVDCSAFVQTLYKYVFGVDLLRTACLQFNSSQYIQNPADLKEGDLVFFRVNTSRISHVGVYLRNNFFVHSASSKGVSIANLSNVYWSKFFAGGGRIVQKGL